MEFIDAVASTLTEHIQNIGKNLYSHKKFNKIIHNKEDCVIYPTPSSRVLEEAEKSINDFDDSYFILHTAHHSCIYSLILTKFDNKLYKVFYYLNDDDLNYSYIDY